MTVYKNPGDVYRELGLRPAITASGPMTHHGGSRLRPEIIEAMRAASQAMIDVHALNDRAGDIVAKYTGAEAGMVCSGASGGLTLQAAAVMTGTDKGRIDRLPDTTGMKNEIIIQNTQRFPFEQGYRAAGARLVGVGNFLRCEPWHIEAAITDRTAAVAFLVAPYLPHNALSLPDVIKVAHAHNLPVLVDAAEVVPPRENFKKYIALGADMVTYSGGKAIRGPQGTGLLAGRKDLIAAARLNAAPNLSIARGQKVAKEEIVGLLKALDIFAAQDENEENARYRRMAQHVVDTIGEVAGLELSVRYDKRDWLMPMAVIHLTPQWRGPSRDTIVQRLLNPDASGPIFIHTLSDPDNLAVHPLNLDDNELDIVATRLKQELNAKP
ncbi:MAG: aminotransferase class V-fold PLP-dependent enzyme [SAR202 cluster bacterium]|nr:aminotransferase class V-fold PLP-dependent enzyme [SAR202 cluster bacterium]